MNIVAGVAVVEELREERAACVDFDLDANVADYLKRFPTEWQDITLEELNNSVFSNNFSVPTHVGKTEGNLNGKYPLFIVKDQFVGNAVDYQKHQEAAALWTFWLLHRFRKLCRAWT